jgi:hypothetical protein
MPHAPEPLEGTAAPPPVLASTALAAIVALQGLGLIAIGVYLIVRAAQPDAGHPGSTEVLGALSVLVGLGVVLMARAALARRPRVRSPLLVLEILCLPIAVTALQGGRWYVGVPLGVAAIAVIVLMGLAGLLVPRDD